MECAFFSRERVEEWRQERLARVIHTKIECANMSPNAGKSCHASRLGEGARLERNRDMLEKGWRTTDAEAMAGQAQIQDVGPVEIVEEGITSMLIAPEFEKGWPGHPDRLRSILMFICPCAQPGRMYVFRK